MKMSEVKDLKKEGNKCFNFLTVVLNGAAKGVNFYNLNRKSCMRSLQ
jgi:hypothetical protein